jgi:hypothetical protein
MRRELNTKGTLSELRTRIECDSFDEALYRACEESCIKENTIIHLRNEKALALIEWRENGIKKAKFFRA